MNALRLVTDAGGGQYIDLSMQDAMLAALGIRMGETLQAGTSPTRLGNENPLRVPANTYRTADDLYIAIIVHNEEQWRPFCDALERDDWIEHPRFRTMSLRVKNRDELNALVAARFADRDSKHWGTRLEEHHRTASSNDYARALSDPQIAHRGLIRELEHALRTDQGDRSAVAHVRHADRNAAAADARSAYDGSFERLVELRRHP